MFVHKNFDKFSKSNWIINYLIKLFLNFVLGMSKAIGAKKAAANGGNVTVEEKFEKYFG